MIRRVWPLYDPRLCYIFRCKSNGSQLVYSKRSFNFISFCLFMAHNCADIHLFRHFCWRNSVGKMYLINICGKIDLNFVHCDCKDYLCMSWSLFLINKLLSHKQRKMKVKPFSRLYKRVFLHPIHTFWIYRKFFKLQCCCLCVYACVWRT